MGGFSWVYSICIISVQQKGGVDEKMTTADTMKEIEILNKEIRQIVIRTFVRDVAIAIAFKVLKKKFPDDYPEMMEQVIGELLEIEK